MIQVFSVDLAVVVALGGGLAGGTMMVSRNHGELRRPIG